MRPSPFLLPALLVIGAASQGCAPSSRGVAPVAANASAPQECASKLETNEATTEVASRFVGVMHVPGFGDTAALRPYLRSFIPRAARYRATLGNPGVDDGEAFAKRVTESWKDPSYKDLDDYRGAMDAAFSACDAARQNRKQSAICSELRATKEGVGAAKRLGLPPDVIKHLDQARLAAGNLDPVEEGDDASDAQASTPEKKSAPPPVDTVGAQCRAAGLPAPPLVVAKDAPPRTLVARVNVEMGTLGHKFTYTGSAFVLVAQAGTRKRVLAVTNAHVVGFAEQVSLTFGDGRTLVALPVVEVDGDHDLALIELPEDSFAAGAALANGLVKELSDVVSVGFPEGSYQIATGAVTNNRLDRAAPYGPVAFIQHSAPIHFGSSGGPLLDKESRVVGVNTILRSDRENTAFAIPASRVSGLVRRFLEGPREIPASEHREACLAAVLGTKVYGDDEAGLGDTLLQPLLSQAFVDSFAGANAAKWKDPMRDATVAMDGIVSMASYGETCATSKRLSDRAFEFELRTYKGTKLFLRTGTSRGAVAITHIELEDDTETKKKH